jgi:glycosyltransferase involved in cell wall biosynthesis
MIPEDFGTLSPEEIQFSDKAEYVKNADGIICVSKFTKERLLAHFPYLSIPISVIPLATNLFRTFPVDLELVNLKSRSNTFIYIGPRGNYKNFRLILFAAARLKVLTNQSFEIFAVGGGKFSDEERILIQNLGLVDFVKQTEMDDFQLSRAYSISRALIFPSRMEGFGIPQIEAFSFGCPVISSGMGALKEFDNGISMKFDANSPDDLADRMFEILNVSSRDFHVSAAAAIKHAKNFSWSETARKTTDFYKLFT